MKSPCKPVLPPSRFGRFHPAGIDMGEVTRWTRIGLHKPTKSKPAKATDINALRQSAERDLTMTDGFALTLEPDWRPKPFSVFPGLQDLGDLVRSHAADPDVQRSESLMLAKACASRIFRRVVIGFGSIGADDPNAFTEVRSEGINDQDRWHDVIP